MTYCEQCGSTSHDEQGFCRGCGTRLPGYAPAQISTAPHKNAYESYLPIDETLQPTKRIWGLWGFAQPINRNVWVAVILALLFGPFGLTYSTYLGAFVMLIVSIAATIHYGSIANLLTLPACAIWAWFAARSANSIY
jgi:hypothetical protein